MSLFSFQRGTYTAAICSHGSWRRKLQVTRSIYQNIQPNVEEWKFRIDGVIIYVIDITRWHPRVTAGIFKQSCKVKFWKYKLRWLRCNILLQTILYIWEKVIVKWLIFHVFLLLEFWNMIFSKIYVCYSHRKSAEDINWWSSGWWCDIWGGCLHVERNIVNTF
jgi:hypothetical protein